MSVYSFEPSVGVKTWFLTVLLTQTLVPGMPMLSVTIYTDMSANVSVCRLPSTRWKMKNVSLSVTMRQLVSFSPIQPLLWECLDTYVLAPASPRGNSLDSRARSHPAILSIWEHINFQKPWIGGSSHHMCLSVPFSLHPPQWLSGPLSNISPILWDVRSHWLYRVISGYRTVLFHIQKYTA